MPSYVEHKELHFLLYPHSGHHAGIKHISRLYWLAANSFTEHNKTDCCIFKAGYSDIRTCNVSVISSHIIIRSLQLVTMHGYGNHAWSPAELT